MQTPHVRKTVFFLQDFKNKSYYCKESYLNSFILFSKLRIIAFNVLA